MTLFFNENAVRGGRFSHGVGAMLTAMVLATCAHAQSGKSPQSRPVPDESRIQHTMRATILCQWPMNSVMPDHAEHWYVFKYLADAHQRRSGEVASGRSDPEGFTSLGAFELLGTHFDEVKVVTFMGGGAGIAWSAAGNKETLLEVLRGEGYEFAPITAPLRGVGAALEGRLPSEAGTRALLVTDDKLQGLDGRIQPGGFTLICRPDRS